MSCCHEKGLADESVLLVSDAARLATTLLMVYACHMVRILLTGSGRQCPMAATAVVETCQVVHPAEFWRVLVVSKGR